MNLHFDENGTPTLSFEAGTEHGAELLEAGILLTFAGDQQRFPADLNGIGDPYLVSLDGLQPGQAYRYQAYARNQVGETLSAMGKLSIGDDSSPGGWRPTRRMGEGLLDGLLPAYGKRLALPCTPDGPTPSRMKSVGFGFG